MAGNSYEHGRVDRNSGEPHLVGVGRLRNADMRSDGHAKNYGAKNMAILFGRTVRISASLSVGSDRMVRGPAHQFK